MGAAVLTLKRRPRQSRRGRVRGRCGVAGRVVDQISILVQTMLIIRLADQNTPHEEKNKLIKYSVQKSG